MQTKKILSATRSVGFALSLAMLLGGCKSKPGTDDVSLTSQVQSRIASDQNLVGQPIQASVANGVATLSGSVSTDAARSIASGDAAQVAGVRTVVNNLVIQAPPAVAADSSMPAPMP